MNHFIYLISIAPFMILWVIFFILRKDLRKEMVTMSLFLGIASVATAYFWWTKDWWTPITITGTVIGIEDFFIGFFSGGLMVSLYEVIFRKKMKKIKKYDVHIGIIALLLLAFLTAILFWGLEMSSFLASSISFVLVTIIILYYRKDLVVCSLYSGLLMLVVSISFYIIPVLFSREWIHYTYSFELSGIRLVNIPIEEFIFWFLAGVFWGPFYEFWQGKKLVDK